MEIRCQRSIRIDSDEQGNADTIAIGFDSRGGTDQESKKPKTRSGAGEAIKEDTSATMKFLCQKMVLEYF